MDLEHFQKLIGAKPDGVFGPESREKFLAAFTNPEPTPLSEEDLAFGAYSLRCSFKQIRAVRKVEGARRGFDQDGRPLMLFERHRFYMLTDGSYGTTDFSTKEPGGYDLPSWELMAAAIARGAIDAAFMTASWGLFQVRGELWSELGYASPWAMARAAVTSEREQLMMLCGYLGVRGLTDQLRAISTSPQSCSAFAAAYNGGFYKERGIHTKLAEAMRL